MRPHIPLVPDQASTAAPGIDLLFGGLTLVTVVFSLIICVAIVYFAVKYRSGHKVDRSNPPLEHLPLELFWTIIPLIISLGLFMWATILYFNNIRPPENTMNLYVVGKQWMWKIQQPGGRWEMNEMHIPAGRPIKLIMTSEDVIHAFFVPAFRLKNDVLPGKYTTIWFEATQEGEYHLFCAEYCGTSHSGMVGKVVVMKPSDYEAWLKTGNTTRTMAAAGEHLFRQYGCSGCHGAGSSVRAPMLEGIYGKPVAIQVPRPGVPLEKTESTTIIADDRYIHDSIVLPEQEIAAGFRPIMPTFKGRLKEEEIIQIIDYIKSLNTSNGTSNGLSAGNSQGANSNNISGQDLRTRTGFDAPNTEAITGGGKISGDVTKNVTGRTPTSSTPVAGRSSGGAGGTVSGDVTKNVTGAVPSSSTPNAANARTRGRTGTAAGGLMNNNAGMNRNPVRRGTGSTPAVGGNRERMPQ